MNPYAIAGLVAGAGVLTLAVFTPFIEPEIPFVQPLEQPLQATLLFAGDAFFDRTIRTTIEEKGGDFIFSCITDVLTGVDATVLNVEGPITNNASVSVGSEIGSPDNFRFTFAPDIASLLLRHNVRVVNLGNNHITNFGYDGVAQTISYLDAAGVAYFGEPDAYSVARMIVQEVPLAFVGYNEFGGDAKTTLAQIKEVKEEGYLPVVYAHWGNEYETTSSLWVQQLAREFVDAGAKLVIGSHPHVVQQSELYNGVHIYYSLGNFMFDQYWNDEVRTGLMVEVMFAKDGVVSVKEIKTYLGRDRRTCVIE